MSEATFFLFKALMDVFTVGVVFNFLFRLLKVDYYNPLVQGIIRAVDLPSQVLRSLLKPIKNIDLSHPWRKIPALVIVCWVWSRYWQ